MILWYKGKYCHVRQHMPTKHVERASSCGVLYTLTPSMFGAWVCIVVHHKQWNDMWTLNKVKMNKVWKLWRKLWMDLSIRDTICTIDNFFTNVEFFLDKRHRGSCARGTITNNHIKLPKHYEAKICYHINSPFLSLKY